MTSVTAGRRTDAGSDFGALLREWRRLRGASQLDLALTWRVLALPDVAETARAPAHEPEPGPTLVLRSRKGEVRLALFSMIATFGTPLDVALQNLRLEFFFPADDVTERWFRQAPARA